MRYCDARLSDYPPSEAQGSPGIVSRRAAPAGVIVVSVLIASLVTALFGTACTDQGGGAPAVRPALPQAAAEPTPVPTEPPVLMPAGSDPLNFILEDVSAISVLDVGTAVRGGAAPDTLVDEWIKRVFDERFLHSDLHLDQVDTIVTTWQFGDGNWYIVQGDFEPGAIRSRLDASNRHTRQDFRGYEVWKGQSVRESVAILARERIVLLGPYSWIEETLKAATRNVGLLEQDSRPRQMLARADRGWYVYAGQGCGMLPSCIGEVAMVWPAQSPPEPPYSNLITWVVEFEDHEEARREARRMFERYRQAGVMGNIDGTTITFWKVIDEDEHFYREWPP